MNIHLYATFRQLAGRKTVETSLSDGSSVRAVIEALIQQVPALRPALIGETGQIQPHVHVFVNGRDVEFLPQGLDTPLTSADKVDIFPPVAGG